MLVFDGGGWRVQVLCICFLRWVWRHPVVSFYLLRLGLSFTANSAF
jgi:hypothetical protein